MSSYAGESSWRELKESPQSSPADAFPYRIQNRTETENGLESDKIRLFLVLQGSLVALVSHGDVDAGASIGVGVAGIVDVQAAGRVGLAVGAIAPIGEAAPAANPR